MYTYADLTCGTNFGIVSQCHQYRPLASFALSLIRLICFAIYLDIVIRLHFEELSFQLMLS